MKQSTWYLVLGGIFSGIAGLVGTWFLIRAASEIEREKELEEQEIPLIAAPERPGEQAAV